MTPRRRRLLASAAIFVATGAGVTLVANAFRSNLVFFHSPSDVRAHKAPAARTFRLGGLVEAGSVQRSADGLTMRFVAHTDIVALKAFMLGLMRFDWQPLPGDPLLLLHLTLVALLMFVFPISKLLHAPGLFFSPTRYQVDNPREVRHVASWAAALDK